MFGKIEEGVEGDFKVLIFDFSGKEMYYKSIVKPLIKNIEVFFFVYDCTERKSFEELKEWI